MRERTIKPFSDVLGTRKQDSLEIHEAAFRRLLEPSKKQTGTLALFGAIREARKHCIRRAEKQFAEQEADRQNREAAAREIQPPPCPYAAEPTGQVINITTGRRIDVSV